MSSTIRLKSERNTVGLESARNSNIPVHEIFVNGSFYTAIVGTNFNPKLGRYTKYRFSTDSLHSIAEPNEDLDVLFNSLSDELLNLSQEALDNLRFKDFIGE